MAPAPPLHPRKLGGGRYLHVLKGIDISCPKSGCFYNNTSFPDQLTAEAKCDATPECDLVMCYKNGKYYLRRATDPHIKCPACHNLAKPNIATYSEVCAGPTGCGKGGCLAGNANYADKGTAEKHCNKTPGCEVVMRWNDNAKFYLRRANDPVTPINGVNIYLKAVSPFTHVRQGTAQGCIGACPLNNKGFKTFEEAAAACIIIPKCEVVMRWTNGLFHLREAQASTRPNGAAALFMKPETNVKCPKNVINGGRCTSHCSCIRLCSLHLKTPTCHC